MVLLFKKRFLEVIILIKKYLNRLFIDGLSGIEHISADAAPGIIKKQISHKSFPFLIDIQKSTMYSIQQTGEISTC